MRPLNLSRRRPHDPRTATLEQYLEQHFPTSDQVLLCSFGGNLTGEQTKKMFTHGGSARKGRGARRHPRAESTRAGDGWLRAVGQAADLLATDGASSRELACSASVLLHVLRDGVWLM
jgi:hypothetical protein